MHILSHSAVNVWIDALGRIMPGRHSHLCEQGHQDQSSMLDVLRALPQRGKIRLGLLQGSDALLVPQCLLYSTTTNKT